MNRSDLCPRPLLLFEYSGSATCQDALNLKRLHLHLCVKVRRKPLFFVKGSMRCGYRFQHSREWAKVKLDLQRTDCSPGPVGVEI